MVTEGKFISEENGPHQQPDIIQVWFFWGDTVRSIEVIVAYQCCQFGSTIMIQSRYCTVCVKRDGTALGGYLDTSRNFPMGKLVADFTNSIIWHIDGLRCAPA